MNREPRKPPLNLLILRVLNARMTLSPQDQRNHSWQEKGFNGELKFDLLTDKLQSDCIVIKGLLLEVNGNEFQIDTTIIFQRTVHLYDVKNYEGDYYYDSEKFYFANGDILKDPLPQLKRCESLFIKLLQELGSNIHVEARVVFINSEFTLMQAPREYPIIYSTQVNQLIKRLNKTPSRLTKAHKLLAQQLLALHKPVSSNMKIPTYEYEKLIKRIMCKLCHMPATAVKGGFVVCEKCGHSETIESAVLRSVKELVMLFPEMKITTNLVHEWCGIVESRKTIRRILLKNYQSVGNTKVRYFLIE